MVYAYKCIARFYSSISRQQVNFLRELLTLKLSGPRKSKIGLCVRFCVPSLLAAICFWPKWCRLSPWYTHTGHWIQMSLGSPKISSGSDHLKTTYLIHSSGGHLTSHSESFVKKFWWCRQSKFLYRSKMEPKAHRSYRKKVKTHQID